MAFGSQEGEGFSKNDKNDLMPCPFCGAYAFTVLNRSYQTWSIRCVDCSVQTCCCQNRIAAINLWNKRVKIFCDGEGDVNIFKPRNPYENKYIPPTPKPVDDFFMQKPTNRRKQRTK